MKKIKTVFVMSEEEFRKNFPDEATIAPLEVVLSFAEKELKKSVEQGLILSGSVEVLNEK